MIFRLWVCLGIFVFTGAVAIAGSSAEQKAEFLVLDKITGRKQIVEISSGETAEFGTLFVRLHHCAASAPEDVQAEAKVFVEIFENPPGGDNKQTRIFSGWMFASSPAINALEHPVYDIWPISCKARTPESRSGRR